MMQQNNWVTTIEYPEHIKKIVHEANAVWKEFCKLPQDLKETLGFENFGGYELKTHDNHHDSKELLHYTLLKHDNLKEKSKNWPEDAKAIFSDLLSLSKQVVESSKDLVIEYLEPYGSELTNGALEKINTWPIRYLHYFPAQSDTTETAHAHCDVGGCTLHLYQDNGGLEYLDSESWHDVPLAEDSTSILPGMDMQLLTKGQVTATCHRVVPTPATAEIGRYSSVLFVNFNTTGRWNKEKYGSLGKQKPGWNYKLSHDEFSQYFIENKDLSTI